MTRFRQGPDRQAGDDSPHGPIVVRARPLPEQGSYPWGLYVLNEKRWLGIVFRTADEASELVDQLEGSGG